ncbi:hypothetical protein [Acetobacter thailandicus]|uniref:hypothetical protein n=1 Tax=Acetobacter thailandicus TaxID=1502842 RepID=UPI001BAC4FFC|nr:hypothetical protein [Acetobacter thailandicus]MBS0985795.1 hypothetical protein [Acetobacter thailandicus]
MLLDSEWHTRIGLPWTRENLTPYIKKLVLWRFIEPRERGPWWDMVSRYEKNYSPSGRLTFNPSWHQLKQKKQGIFGYGYSSTLSPIQGYRHPWVMNKREFLEAYNRIIDDIAPTDTIPDDRIRIPSLLGKLDSYVAPMAILTASIPYINKVTGTVGAVVGTAATLTSLCQNLYDGRESNLFEEELPRLKEVYIKEKYYRENEL